MKPWTLPEKIIGALVVLLAIAGAAFLIYHNGVKRGAVKQELVTNAAVVKDLRAKAVVADKAAGVEVKKSVAKRAEYHTARAKVELKGDTVIADGQTVVLPSVASLIKVADSRGAQDSTTIGKQAAQDTANKAVNWGLGQRVDLLEHEKEPWCGRKCGVTIGVVGTVTVVVVVAKVIQAISHKRDR